MNPELLRAGQLVRIKNFEKIPSHWNDRGKMNKWRGQIVTIAFGSASNDYFKIAEDHGEWSWNSSDFEEVDSNRAVDPNILFQMLPKGNLEN